MARTTKDGPFCDKYHKTPILKCAFCGTIRPCFTHVRTTGQPRCRPCSRKLEPCSSCQHDKVVVARTTPVGELLGKGPSVPQSL